jgi:hypothetical protein
MIFTNYGENKIADFYRGQGITLPGSWYMAFLSAYSESSVTEVGVGLTRVAYTRALAYWSGTQAAGSTAVSAGTSHTTSNNVTIPMGTATGSASAVAVGLFDATSSGNCWAVCPLDGPLAISAADTPQIDVGQMQFTWGQSGGMSDYLANKMIDLFFRAVAFTFPANQYMAGFTSAPTNGGGGTEIGGGVGYARVVIPSTMAAWSGTQGPGTTTASSGTEGRISNNAQLAHPQPTGNQGTWVAGGLYDAPSGGNLLRWHNLPNQRSVSAASSAPTWAPNAIGLTIK